MSQAQREAVIRRLRAGQVETLVATDVAARGLDVERINRVINYDMPNDEESYVHRIGRTGRAGRTGMAVLFVTPRQQRMKREIERYTGQRIEPMRLPTKADLAERRIALFKERIIKTLKSEELDLYLSLVEELAEESGNDIAEIAAAAARLAQGDKPLKVALEPEPEQVAQPEDGMTRLFIDVGRFSNVSPADIVGAIANEAGVPGKAIGAIDIHDRFTLVDVPSEYIKQVLRRMKRSRIRSHNANIRAVTPRDMSLNEPPPAKRAKGKEGAKVRRRNAKRARGLQKVRCNSMSHIVKPIEHSGVDPRIAYPCYKSFDEFVDVGRLKSLNAYITERIIGHIERQRDNSVLHWTIQIKGVES